MANERKSVTIHYRKFQRPAGVTTPSLEQMVRTAMNGSVDGHVLKSRYSSRVLTAADDNLFVNTYSDSASSGDSLVFGDVIHFTKGHLQALFSSGAPTAPSAAVQQMPAPAASEYVHSQMFWMVKGDHVFVIQSTSLRTEQWEQYLTWLLSVKTQTLVATVPIILVAKFDQTAIGGDLDDIKEIVIGGVAARVVDAPVDPGVPREQGNPVEREVTASGEVNAERKTGWTQAREILSTLLGGDANVNSFLSGVPPDADLSVSVHIGYKTKKRQISRESLKQLETGLRNLPDSQLEVKSKSSTKAADGTIRLQHPASIKLIKAVAGGNEIIGSLLDPADVMRAMFEAYSVFLSNGKITQ